MKATMKFFRLPIPDAHGFIPPLAERDVTELVKAKRALDAERMNAPLVPTTPGPVLTEEEVARLRAVARGGRHIVSIAS